MPDPVDPIYQGGLGPRVGINPDKLKQALADAIGGPQATFTDPLGVSVEVGEGLIDHYLENPSRLNGRERYFPYLRELVEAPQEIWAGFSIDPASGTVGIRRRYIRVLNLPGQVSVMMVTEYQNGNLPIITFFEETDPKDVLKNIRSGLLLWPG